jgi:hypothetical protein
MNEGDYEMVITLDAKTVQRLAQVGRYLGGVHPRKIAEKLLRDVLNDDAMIEACLTQSTTRPN